MPNTIRLVSKSSDSTILVDFDDGTGANNATNFNSIKTYIHGDSFDLGRIPTDIVYFEPANAPGGSVARTRHGLTEMRFRFDPLATSEDNLFGGIGKLGKYLNEPSEYTLLLQLDGWGEKRYVDFVSGQIPALLYGQARGLHHTLNLLRDPNGVEVVLMRQPYLRGPSVTVGPTTVQNDPADASGRFIEVTNAGNAAAPAAVKVQGDTGAKVQEIVIARKSVGPYASTRVTDYTGGTQYGQILTGTANGWTGTIPSGSDTTSGVSEATDGSGGTVTETTHATDPTVMKKRIRMTRTANMDSLRGTFDVWVRIKNTAVAEHVVQLRWAHSLADPATFSEPEVIHESVSSLHYVDVKLGRISVPQGHTLGGLALEFWSRRDSGAGNLRWDFFSLVPADESLSTIVVPEGSPEQWDGIELVTPVSNPAGGTAGSPGIGGRDLRLDTTTDNCGTPPNTGLVWPAGRHRFSFKLGNGTPQLNSVDVAVRNITDSAYADNRTFLLAAGEVRTVTIAFDIGTGTNAATDAYQAQVDNPTLNGGGVIHVDSIKHEFVPYIAANEEAHSDPDPRMPLLHKMDASDNIMLPLSVEGTVPVWLAPGLNALYIHYADVPITSELPGPESKISRDCAVTITYSPRYLT